MYDESREVYINIYDKKADKIVINELEELVKQLVAWSIPLNFHIEALKCQSIIMRTKLVRQMRAYGGCGVSQQKEADILMENFVGVIPLERYKEIWGRDYEDYVKKIEAAVMETKGSVLLFNNKPIDARAHLVCGGSTENSENVEGNVVQYLRKVLCNHCQNSPYSLNYKDIPIEEVENKLGVKLTNDEVLKDTTIDNIIDDVLRDEQNRVTKIKIGGKEFKGKEVMDILNINSTRFGWRPQIMRFFTIGKGDGLGLCQYGANNMACEGSSAEEILKYYYTGIEIKKIQNPCINMPLKGKLVVIDPAHGGEDSDDHVGSQGLREKDVNLSIALHLEKELQSLGAEVYLTRREDIVVHLNDRAQMANSIAPHFFISIHQNYFNHPSKSGTEIYYFRGDTVAKELAREIMTALTEEIETLDKGIKPADFFLLREVIVSSIHVEVAYISNFAEEKMLMDDSFRKRAAKSIAKGFVNFYRYI
ncbi:N-acetylmuramoyl-L-alanine amidase [Alkaliphilus sp. MSJ-5]|uniref:N-acetylmuramoyl-L-alanine amidase n=1 Tax=Alkaliphilus flagellatus TaxID=2841507 RepID=A0ABS6G3T9_9FIRM|nr:N-acetylmuramoyl-L-alanine amidase [Alkaliphilus flagellatus]MBU5676080.1 N-acetylmuramoyl-L-alanine amidase [Alkaliphilus flagellatus]